MADGLDSLNAMRAKTTVSRRTLPPPRHKPRSTPVPMPEPTSTAQPAPPAAPPTEAQGGPVTVHDDGNDHLDKLDAKASAHSAPSDLIKVSIYLDDTTDTYLETVRAAARATRPRVDATRSAVVRLALTRLGEQLQPTEVVAELQRSAAAHTGPGRKRA